MAREDDDEDALGELLGAGTRANTGVRANTTATANAATDVGFAGGDASRTSANAPRVRQNARGGWELTEHGNTRQLQGNEVADAQGYASQFWRDNPTGFQAGNANSINDAYQQFTGRDADAAGAAAHARNPGGFTGAIGSIADSQEAQNYRARPITGMGLSPPGAGGAGAGAVQPSVFQGFQPRHPMEGFDFNREQDTGKSAKDAFAFLSNQAPPPPINDKAALGAWFQQYIEPGMNQLGHHVTGVNGDTFSFSNWQGDFTVDYGRGAGAEGGALAWQVDPASAQMGNGPYVPQQGPGAPGGGGRGAGGAAGPAGPSAPPVNTTLPVGGGAALTPASGNSTAYDQIMDEINALAGGRSVLDEDALQQQLR